MNVLVRYSGFAGLGLLAGCYTLKPAVGPAPEVGTVAAFDVNDAGRVALGGAMGPEIAQVEGRVVERDGEGYLVAVSNIRLLRGGQQVWSGEQVRLQPEYIGTTYQRRFSLGRTIALGTAGAGAFALIVTRSILGGGRDPSDGVPDDTANTRLGRP